VVWLNDPGIIVLATACGVLLFLLVLLAYDDGGERHFRRRLQRVKLRRASAGEGPRSALRPEDRLSALPVLDRLLRRVLPRPEKLRARLERTGFRIGLAEYLLVSLLLGAVSALLLHWLFSFPGLAAIAAGIIQGAGLPYKAVGYLGRRRTGAFLKGLPDAIDLMVRGLRSGLPVSESIANVGRELPEPVGGEFARINDRVRMGEAMETAMWDTAHRLDIADFKYLVIAMAIQKETGGNLAETLENLSNLLRQRRQLKLKIKAMSAEARVSAWIIGSLPFLMFAILMLLNPGYVMALVQDPRGNVMLGVGLGFIATGVFIMAKMVRFDP
jgi:tight adherence protein B